MVKYLKICILFGLGLQFLLAQHVQCDTLKIPILIGHYIHHNFKHEPISLSDFLTKHYADAEHKEADKNEHEQLPFQHDCCGYHTSAIVWALNSPLEYTLVLIGKPINPKPSIYKQTYFPSNYYSSIWRPPKAC